MNRKIIPFLTAAGLAMFFGACSNESDSGLGAKTTCEDNDKVCLDEDDAASSSSKAKSSSSAKAKSSSSKEEAKSSSSKAKSSSSTKDEGKSSSSEDEVKVEYDNTTPNLADLEVSGDTLFAVFQRQTADFILNDNGLLAMYNVKTGELLDTIQLATKNPVSVNVVDGNVFVATWGPLDDSWSYAADKNRGLEKVDLSKKKSSLLVSGEKLGGGIQFFTADYNNNKGYASILNVYGMSTPVVEIDLSTGSVKKIDDFSDASGGLAVDSKGLLYIGDRGVTDYSTYAVSGEMVFTYDGSKVEEYSNAGEKENRQPYSIVLLNDKPYVCSSDYSSGMLYMNYADFNDSDAGIQFSGDTKLAVANDKLFVLDRDSKSSGSITLFNTKSKSADWQISADHGNPYTVVPATSKSVWVAFYGIPEIREISMSNGKTLNSINTEAFCTKKLAE